MLRRTTNVSRTGLLKLTYLHVTCDVSAISVKGISNPIKIPGAFIFVSEHTTHHNMAIARPIRVLGLVAIGLWVFFLYQVFGPAKIPKGPGDTLENMERDPNLDRMQ